MALRPCPSCARHVRSSETSCPFCANVLPDAPATVPTAPVGTRLSRAAILFAGATALAACGGETTPPGQTSSSSSGSSGASSSGSSGTSSSSSSSGDMGNPVPAYGAPAPPMDAGDEGGKLDEWDGGGPMPLYGQPIIDAGF